MNSRQSFDDAAEAEKTCDPDKRNRYFRHRNLTASDYRLEQAYGIERRRLINRTITGWGVARGFALELDEDDSGAPTGKLHCGSGLALDRHGRELVRRTSGAITAKEIILLNNDGQPSDAPQDGASPYYLLQAHYAERRQGPVRAGNICDCGKQEWNYLSETVIFSLLPLNDSMQLNDVARPGCEKCGCAHNAGAAEDRYACLCDWTMQKLATADDAGTWNGDVCYRLGDPVPLAIVTVSFDHCNHARFDEPMDACLPRRIIKTNDALFDLIRGCDLTGIKNLSWAPWHDTVVGWKDFEDQFPPQSANPRGNRDKAVDTKFEITFSRAVNPDTLRASCVSFRVYVAEAAGGWLQLWHVPIAGLKVRALDEASGLPTSAIIQVKSGWNDDEVWGASSVFGRQTRVEIEIRGDLILDCHGQAVDATCAGPTKLPSSNGTPGGTFISTFNLCAEGVTAAPGDNPQQATRTQS